MISKSSQKNIRISPRKLNLIANSLRGQNAIQSLERLRILNKKGAGLLSPILQTAIANASHVDENVNDLVISTINMGPGVTIKAGKIRAKGSFDRILKRTSNVEIILDKKIKESNNE